MLRRMRAYVEPSKAQLGTSNVIVLSPFTTATVSAIRSAGPPQVPSALKSIQASSFAPLGAFWTFTITLAPSWPT